MTRSLYRVYRQSKFLAAYSSSTRNSEDMIRSILDKHYKPGYFIKITRMTGKETVTVFSKNKLEVNNWNLEY